MVEFDDRSCFEAALASAGLFSDSLSIVPSKLQKEDF
jgi:hypothetical protein